MLEGVRDRVRATARVYAVKLNEQLGLLKLERLQSEMGEGINDLRVLCQMTGTVMGRFRRPLITTPFIFPVS